MSLDVETQEDTEFVRFWNTVLEPKFTKYRHILQGGLSRHSAAVLPKLPLKNGMSVLDVGCGWGDMSIQVAERVGPEGRVVGIDCVEAFLEEARRDAAAAGLSHVEFKRGDAEVGLPESEFDYVVARFGTMFGAGARITRLGRRRKTSRWRTFRRRAKTQRLAGRARFQWATRKLPA
jgi:ubiquinone/menaquinone biosynthesis C-methylase UbiE